MRNKNVLLAVIAFTFAISSAFASMLVDRTISVKARRTEGSGVTCVQLNKTCDNNPTSTLCQVQISVTNPAIPGGTQTATSTGTFKTYEFVDGVGCETVLFDADNAGLQTAAPIGGGTIWELVP